MNRIVIFLGCHGHGSGAERVLEYLLAGAVGRRDEICLLSPSSSSVTTCARDLGYEWIPWISGKDGMIQNLRAYRRLTQHEGRVPPGSLVHAWHTRGFEWAVFLGRKWNVPCSGTLHDDPDPSHGQFGWLRKKIIRRSAARLDGVAVVSEAVALRCKELGWKRDVAILRNGLPDAPLPRRDPARTLRLGFMATSLRWKGIGMLPDLIQRTADLPLEWNLFGSRAETGDTLDRLTAMPRVRYFGHVPLDEALKHVDVMLHLSLNLDPYPTVLLEAARAGIPAIATTTGGSPEIVSDGSTGILVPPGDGHALETAIRRMARDAQERHAMGAAARERYRTRFRVEHMVAHYFAFWNRLRDPQS